MNDAINEEFIKQRNMHYYNQMLLNDRSSSLSKSIYQKTHQKKKVSFASQEINFKDFLFIPEELEAVFYTLYGVFIPYLVGAVFLFFFVAGGSYENFKLLNMDAFLIIWLIGYEVVAVFSLIWIMILYLQYDSEEVQY